MKDLHLYKNDLLMKIIYICKKATPKNIYFFFIFFLFKLLGNIILSHNFLRVNESSKNDFNINRFLRVFTYFIEFNMKVNSLKNYDKLCIAIFFLAIFPIIILSIIYKTIFKLKLKFIKIPKKISYLIKICSVLLTIIVFLSQHLLEILYFIYAHSYAINNITSMAANKTENLTLINQNYISFFYSLEGNLILSKYFFIVLNTISIAIINLLIHFYFVFINEPFLNSKSSIKLYHNKSYLFLLVLSFNLQSLHYFEYFFNENTKLRIRFFLLAIPMFINFCFFIQFTTKYNFQNFNNNFLNLVFTICLFSCILDLIIFHSLPANLDSLQMIFKLGLEIILSFIVNYTIYNYKIKRTIGLLNTNLFSKNKQISLNSLFVFSDIIQNSLTNSINFLSIFKMIDQHKLKCRIEECPCQVYEFNNYLKSFEVNRQIKFLQDEEKLEYFKKIYHNIITLGENEIVNMIYQYYKGKEISSNYNLFLLHVDYIFHFKRNHLLSNYLIEQYTLYIKSLPFIYRFYLFIYKKRLIKQHYESIKEKPSMAINFNFHDFLKYYKMLEKINRLVLKNCENFEKLIYIKKTFDNNRLNISNRDSSMDINYQKLFQNVENIFLLCENLNKNYSKLVRYLENNFKLQRLRNIETSYVLCNFFFLINKELPFNLKNLFLQIDNYSVVENYSSSYAEKKIYHPIIINVNKSESFFIKYISQKLCDLLEYNKYELINEDIHLLIPSLFLEQHKLAMKKLIFLESESKIQKESFMLTKNKFYFAMQLTSSFLPTINENTLLIMDAFPIKENPNSRINVYNFILDKDAKFITFSKNFVENYSLNLQMFNKLKISFCNFFDINRSQLEKKFKKAIKFIEKIDYSKTNSILKIFHQVNLIKSLTFLDEDNKLHINYNVKNTKFLKTLEFVRTKEKLIPSLIKIKKKIQEDEIELNYLLIINELEKKFYRHTSTNKVLNMKKIISKTLGKSGQFADNNVNPNGILIPKNSNGDLTNLEIDKNNFDLNIKNNNQGLQNIEEIAIDQFFIKFNIMNMGNIPFFYVQLYEKKETELDITNYMNFQMNLALNQFEFNKNSSSNNINNFKGSTNSFRDVLKLDIPSNSITESAKDYLVFQEQNSQGLNNAGVINSTNNINNNELFFQATNANLENINNFNFNFSKDSTLSNGINYFKFMNTKSSGNMNNFQNNNVIKNFHFQNLNSLSTNNHKEIQASSYNSFTFNNPSLSNINNITNNHLVNYIQFNNKNTNTSANNFSLYLNNSTFPLTGQNTKTSSEKIQQPNYLNKIKSTSMGLTKPISNSKGGDSLINIKNIFTSNNNNHTKLRNKTHSVLHSEVNQKEEIKEKFTLVFLFIFLFIQIFLAFFSFYFKSNIANISFGFFNINYYALLTKLSVYYTSSSVMSACSNIDIDPKMIDNFEVDISDYKKNFKIHSDDLLTNFYNFMNFLSVSDPSKISEIMNILDEPIKFKLLYTDWTSYYRNSNILDEMSYYHYYIAGLQRNNTFQFCRLQQFFYYEKFEKAINLNNINLNYNHKISNSSNSISNSNNHNININKNIQNGNKKFNTDIYMESASSEEIALYYIIYNVFHVFRERLELISLTINNGLISYHIESQKTLLIFNLIILFFALILVMIMIFSVRNYRRKILDMIFSIFIKDKTNRFFEEKLKNFKTIVKNLDKNVCLNYEENCKRLLSEESIIFEEKNRELQKKENSKGKNSRGFKSSNDNFATRYKKESERIRDYHKQTKKNINLTNTTLNPNVNLKNLNEKLPEQITNKDGFNNISNLNASSNNLNNSFNPLNNQINNNVNYSINANSTNLIGSNNINNNDYKNENSRLGLYHKDKDNVYNKEEKNEDGVTRQNLDLSNISMRIIRFSYLVLFIAFIFYTVISLSNILINNSDYKRLILANQISVNFLNRIPIFAELILYYKISVLFNNINFIKTDPLRYNEKIYSNYFSVSYDKKSDSIFRELNQSEYLHIYYKLKIIRKNINLFMGSGDPFFTGVLISLREYESKLNTQDFCLIESSEYLNNYFSTSSTPNKDFFEAFKLLNKEAQECMSIGKGINKLGLNLALDSLLASTNNLYLDFARAKSDANITEALTNLNFLRGVLDVEYTFRKANSNFLKLILNEMSALYDSLKNVEFIYSILGLLFNLIFILIVIFGVIKKLQKYFISLGSAIDKFKIALIPINN